MKIKWFAALASLGFSFWLTACTGTPGTGDAPVYTECDPAYMVAPTLISLPDNAVIQSLQAHFEWEYPGHVIIDTQQQQVITPCNTASFHVHLSSGPYFQDNLGGEDSGAPASFGIYSGTWSTGTILKPGTEYRWSIQPFSQGVDGPISVTRTFFTGPLCDSDNLSVPIPLSPLNHWIVNDLEDLTLNWRYPDGCLPDSYNVEISPMMQFDGSPLNDNTGSPTTSWAPTHILEDCTRYYWHVTAVKDGIPAGQGSQVFNFRVDLTGTCAPEAIGSIQGTVWEDQCVGPGSGTPMPDPLPLGCATTAVDTLFTNQTYDPGEPGIPGLVVSLGSGPCPSTGLRDVPTWGDGMFDFYMVSPGTYCVSVDIHYAWNTSVLLPGSWTVPAEAVGYALANRTITVSAGQETNNVDFGWWYKYGSAWGSTNATVFGMVWHDMCSFTPGDLIPDPLPAGCAIDEWGNVHADEVHQADEPGIPGVVVDIGPGDCPSAGLTSVVTDANGYYSFPKLAPGKYCLRIDPDHGSSNEAILLPGSWTVIPSGHEGMTFRPITLTANHTLPGQDFGWDFDNLPPASTPTPTPAPLTFTPNINAYCRFGPDQSFPSIEIAMAGQAFLVDGRNLDSTWYRIMISASKGCWVPVNSGSPSGDPSGVRVLADVPTPTPTQLVNCSLFSDEKGCEVQPVCIWIPAVARLPYCGNK